MWCFSLDQFADSNVNGQLVLEWGNSSGLQMSGINVLLKTEEHCDTCTTLSHSKKWSRLSQRFNLDLGQRSFDAAASLTVYRGGCFPELIFIARECLYVWSVFNGVLSSNSVYSQNILFLPWKKFVHWFIQSGLSELQFLRGWCKTPK